MGAPAPSSLSTRASSAPWTSFRGSPASSCMRVCASRGCVGKSRSCGSKSTKSRRRMPSPRLPAPSISSISRPGPGRCAPAARVRASPPSMDRLVGRTLGAYDLQGLLGQGGMGAVFRAVHRGLKQPRALKVLPPHLAWDKSFVERFQQEATIAASLRHPNIVLIYDIGEEEGFYFIAMDLLEGQSLRDLLQREGRLPAERTLNLLAQLAGAVDFAHRKGVVHRDLK